MPLTKLHEEIIEATIGIYIDDVIDNDQLTPAQKKEALSAMLADAITPDMKAKIPEEVLDSVIEINRIYHHECPQNVTRSGAYFERSVLVEVDRVGDVIYEPNGHGQGTVIEKKGVFNLRDDGEGKPTRDNVRKFIKKIIDKKAASNIQTAPLAATMTQVGPSTSISDNLCLEELEVAKKNLARLMIPTLIKWRRNRKARAFVKQNIKSLAENCLNNPQQTAEFLMTSYAAEMLQNHPETFFELIRKYATDSAKFKALCDEMSKLKGEHNQHYLSMFIFRVALYARDNTNVAVNVLQNYPFFKSVLNEQDIEIFLENNKGNPALKNILIRKRLIGEIVLNEAFILLASRSIKIAQFCLKSMLPYQRFITGDRFANIIEPYMPEKEKCEKLFEGTDNNFKYKLLFKSGRYSPLVAFCTMQYFSKEMELVFSAFPEWPRFQKQCELGKKEKSSSAAHPSHSHLNSSSAIFSSASSPSGPPRAGGATSQSASLEELKKRCRFAFDAYFDTLDKKDLQSIIFHADLLAKPTMHQLVSKYYTQYKQAVDDRINSTNVTIEQLGYLVKNVLNAGDPNSKKPVIDYARNDIKEELEALQMEIEKTLKTHNDQSLRRFPFS